MPQDSQEQPFSKQAPRTGSPSRTGVFLIHGLTGSPTEMSPLDKALRRAGYQTAVPLIAGHGAGHKELLATTWEDWREGLRRDLRALAQTCDEVIIVGLCIGGLLGLLLAADEEKVKGFVSLSPDLNYRVPGPGTPWTRFLLPIVYRVPLFMRYGYWTQKPPYGIKNPRLQRRIAKAVAESVRGQTKDFGTFRMYAGTFLQLERLQAAAKQTLPRVKCPALIIHSFEDSMFSIRNATVMYQLLGSPKKEIALITGCDHVITVDLRKDDVARRVGRFIAASHAALADIDEAEDGFFSCEISPRPPMGLDKRKAHNLIVRKGSTERLALPLFEAGACRTGRFFRDGGALKEEWQLARAAMDALRFTLKKQLAIETDFAGHACTASTLQALRSWPALCYPCNKEALK